MTLSNGIVGTYSYDALGRPTSAEHGRALQGTTLTAPDATVTYAYAAASRLLQLVDTEGGTITRTFDDHNRLTLESTVTYTYDAADRRLSMTAGSQALREQQIGRDSEARIGITHSLASAAP